MKLDCVYLPFCLSVVLFWHPATNASEIKPDQSHNFFQTAKQWEEKAAYDSAILYYQKAFTNFKSLRNWKQAVLSLAAQGKVYVALGNSEKALELLNQSRKLGGRHLSSSALAFAFVNEWTGLRCEQNLRDFPKAETYYEKALKIFVNALGNQNLDVARCYNRLAGVYISMNEFEKARPLLSQSEAIIIEMGGPHHAELFDLYSNYANLYKMHFAYDSSLLYLERAATNWLQNQRPVVHPAFAANCLSEGHIYRRQGNYEKAEQFYMQAKEIYEKVFTKDHHIGSVYSSLATLYQQNMDYEKSIDFNQKALLTNSKTLGRLHLNNGIVKNNLGVCYALMERNQEAIVYYQGALAIFEKTFGPKHLYVANVNVNLALAYMKLDQHAKALSHMLTGATIEAELFGEDNLITNEAMVQVGEIYCYLGDFEKADRYYQKVKGFVTRTKQKALETTSIYRSLAIIDTEQGRFIDALENCKLGLEAAGIIDTTNHSLLLPEFPQAFPKDAVIDMLRERSKALQQICQQQPGNQDYLKAAIDNAEKLADLYKGVIRENQREDVQLLQIGKMVALYEQSVGNALRLFQLSGAKHWKEKAFYLTEESKAILLLQNLQETKAREFAGISDSLLDQEQSLKKQIYLNESKLVNTDPGDSSYNKNLRVYLEAKQKHADFLSALEKYYPDYYRLKYFSPLVKIEDLQNMLSHNQHALVEYMVGEKFVYAFVLTKTGLSTVSIPNDSTLEQAARAIRLGLMGKKSDQYTENAFFLYKNLFYPLKKILDKEKISRITLVPDSYLHFLPFEALLKSRPNDEQNYRNFNYLLYDYQISYAFSAKLALEDEERITQPNRDLLLGFAPDFSNVSGQGTENYHHFIRDNYQVLQGAKAELQEIGDLLQGDCYFENQATESNFKKLANRYKVIHLATHAIVDDENPQQSRLIFSADSAGEDGNLYSYELYNLRLNADLVTLSACNTGYGKLQKGEGIMSLARGFAYSGCPNIVMSLWPAEDKQTAKIMEIFYLNLSEGMEIDKALWMAKKSYLATANPLTASPFYWSNFIYTGNSQPLALSFFNRGEQWLALMALLILLSALYLLIRKQKKQSQYY